MTKYYYYLLKVPGGLPDPLPPFVDRTQEAEIFSYAYKSGRPDFDPLRPPVLEDPRLSGASLVTVNDQEGVPYQINAAEYEAIRPLGNFPERAQEDENGNPVGVIPEGIGTLDLDFNHVAGTAQRRLSDAGLYLDDNSPFAIEFRYKWFDNPGAWGWRGEFLRDEFGDREPVNHWVAAYQDPEFTQFWYQTGALQQGPSEWQKDDTGGTPTVWFTEWGAQHGADKEPIYLAVCEGHLTEERGKGILHPEVESIVYLLWDRIQGGGSGGEWVETGILCTQAGPGNTLLVVDTPDVLQAGDRVRLDNDPDRETVIQGLYPGQTLWYEIDPPQASQANDLIWRLE